MSLREQISAQAVNEKSPALSARFAGDQRAERLERQRLPLGVLHYFAWTCRRSQSIAKLHRNLLKSLSYQVSALSTVHRTVFRSLSYGGAAYLEHGVSSARLSSLSYSQAVYFICE